jgi:hypothetical protein
LPNPVAGPVVRHRQCKPVPGKIEVAAEVFPLLTH